MTPKKPPVITKVSWHTKRPGNPDPPARYYLQYWEITNFLQTNGLTQHQLAESLADINDDFEIRSADLTEEGFQFMRTGYQKWLRMLDRGGDPSDTHILEKELAKLRGTSGVVAKEDK